MLASVAAIFFVSDVRIVATERVTERMRILWQDIYSMVRSAIPLFTIVLVCSPIGAGAMNNLWSAVAPDWSTGPDTVALVTGILNGVITARLCSPSSAPCSHFLFLERSTLLQVRAD
jgi:hypothetical protein